MDSYTLLEEVGIKICSLRLQRGWTLKDLAHYANIDKDYLSDIEDGQQNIALEIIEKIAISFNIHVKEFFKGGRT